MNTTFFGCNFLERQLIRFLVQGFLDSSKLASDGNVEDVQGWFPLLARSYDFKNLFEIIFLFLYFLSIITM